MEYFIARNGLKFTDIFDTTRVRSRYVSIYEYIRKSVKTRIIAIFTLFFTRDGVIQASVENHSRLLQNITSLIAH